MILDASYEVRGPVIYATIVVIAVFLPELFASSVQGHFVGPLALGWMAWETAKIRSTQSATGILYVVVILCFLGELTSQLLLGKTGVLL